MIPRGFISISKAYEDLRRRYNSEAFGRLEFPLSTGELQASWFDPQGGEHPLSATVWQNMGDSGRVDIFRTGTALSTADGTTLLRTVVVREDDLAALFPSENKASSVDTMEAGSAAKAGRLPKYDWDAIWAGIVLIEHEQGLPKSQDELIEKVQQWFEESFGKDRAPGRTTLQPRIAKLRALMDGGAPSVVFQSPSKAKNRAVKTRIKPTK